MVGPDLAQEGVRTLLQKRSWRLRVELFPQPRVIRLSVARKTGSMEGMWGKDEGKIQAVGWYFA